MNVLIQYGLAMLGFVLGFGIGILALAHVTRGEKMQELMKDKDKKFWLGLFGWFFAVVGAWVGWQLGSFALEGLGY